MTILMHEDVRAEVGLDFITEAKNNNGIKISRGNNLKRIVILRDDHYHLMSLLKMLTMW